MNNLLLVDSDILIDVGRNEEIAVSRLKTERAIFNLAISSNNRNGINSRLSK